MYNKQKVIVTGANGFIGSHLVEKLVALNFDVHCIIRESSNTKWIKGLPVTFHKCGLTNIDALTRAMENSVYVFHLAGVVVAKDYAGYHFGNVILTENVLQAAIPHKSSIKKVIITSSLAAAGPTTYEKMLTEDLPTLPISQYGKAKEAQENAAKKFMPQLSINIVRPPVVYGERDTEVLLFFKTIKGGLLPLIGNKKKLLSLVYVKDLVDGLIACATNEQYSNEIYFIGSEKNYTWYELGQFAASALSKKPFTLIIPHFVVKILAVIAEAFSKISGGIPTLNREKAKEMVQQSWACSSAKAMRQLNYSPKYSIEQGMAQTVQWYKEKGWL